MPFIIYGLKNLHPAWWKMSQNASFFVLKKQSVIRWTWQRTLTPKVFICVNCWLLTSTKRLNTSLQMILSIITDRGWVFVDYIYIGRANLLQLIFIISFSLHAKALLVKTVRAVLLNMYWTPIAVTVNLDFAELTANEEVFWKFIVFPVYCRIFKKRDAKAKLKLCSWKCLVCCLKPEKEIFFMHGGDQRFRFTIPEFVY